MQHSVYFTDKERSVAAADRYLGLLEGALLNEHYIEQEIRISYLLECSERGITPRPEALRDPARQLTEELQRLRRARHAGDTVDGGGLCSPTPPSGASTSATLSSFSTPSMPKR